VICNWPSRKRSDVQLQSTETLTKVRLAAKKAELPNLDGTDQVEIVGVC